LPGYIFREGSRKQLVASFAFPQFKQHLRGKKSVKVYISIDDTDILGSRGTGALASMLAGDVEKYGWGTCSYITRHQLLVHPDVPYTSHNSSMCFSASIHESGLEPLISYASRFLEEESAEGSDPGLCIAVANKVSNPRALIEFGKRAKRVVVKKREALDLAGQLEVHLSDHGGTGHGVIGALAGVGLRLSGNDGRIKGGIGVGAENSVIKVSDICLHPYVDAVSNLKGKILSSEDLVMLGDKVKTVLQGGRSVLLVIPSGSETGVAPWRTCPMEILRRF
jgi:hypothetical protein